MGLLEIIEKLAPEMEKNPCVHAMWLEGSYATGKFTEKSDIDVWLDVDDGTFKECVTDFREKLSQIVEIKKEETRGIYSEDPKLMKQTFYLKDFPEGQVVELDLQEHSRDFKFSKKNNTIKVLFDKNNTIQWA